jgi:hypothetical protein
MYVQMAYTYVYADGRILESLYMNPSYPQSDMTHIRMWLVAMLVKFKDHRYVCDSDKISTLHTYPISMYAL